MKFKLPWARRRRAGAAWAVLAGHVLLAAGLSMRSVPAPTEAPVVESGPRPVWVALRPAGPPAAAPAAGRGPAPRAAHPGPAKPSLDSEDASTASPLSAALAAQSAASPLGAASATSAATVASTAEPSPAAVTAPTARAPAVVVHTAHPDHAHCPPAPYPSLLRERGIEGVVRVQVRVDTEGRAAQALVAQGSGFRLFDEAALARALACRFVPARRGDERVEGWVDFPVRFALVG